ncbi:MAG: TrkA family potassium uptake protein [Muribaculaceae bacterium]|nr:TrkA family potassium uptake protein [Muribaculaceae bacterium]
MRYLIIGLGIYGSNLAIDLTALGHEVIGADIRPNNIEAIKDYISTVYQVDSTEESALSVLPLRNVDLVIVAIGENFGASVKTVALLKKMGVKKIFARAIDKLHESILEGFDIQRILTPEQRAAADLTNEMELGTHVTSMQIDSNTHILKFKAPDFFVGERYDSLGLSDYGIKLVAVTRPRKVTNLLGISRDEAAILDFTAPDITVEADDVFTVIGSNKGFKSLFRNMV